MNEYKLRSKTWIKLVQEARLVQTFSDLRTPQLPLLWPLASFPTLPSSLQDHLWTVCPWNNSIFPRYLDWIRSINSPKSIFHHHKIVLPTTIPLSLLHHVHHYVYLWLLSISTYSLISLSFSMVSLVLTFLWISFNLSSNQSTWALTIYLKHELRRGTKTEICVPDHESQTKELFLLLQNSDLFRTTFWTFPYFWSVMLI